MTGANIREQYRIDSDKIIQNLFISRIKDKFYELKEYHEKLERVFHLDKKRVASQYEKEIEKYGQELTPYQRSQVDDIYSEEHYKIEDIYLKNIRYFTVVTLYSLIEVAMNDLCHYLRQFKKINLELQDLRGEGTERAKLYLIKICSIDFSQCSHEWNEISKLNKIRNCIIHSLGDVEGATKPAEIRNIIINSKGISLDNDRHIRIEESYVLDMIKNAENYLDILYKKAFLKV